jgi:hypothetical protein
MVDRSRAQIPFIAITGAIPRQQHTKGKIMSRTFQPIAHLSIHPITASILLRESDGKAYYTANIQRRYKDENGAWRYTETFFADDLLLVAKIADQAHTEIEKLKAADREAKWSNGRPSDEG